MAKRGVSDDLPYRTPVTERAVANRVTPNEQDYSTLQNVYQILKESVNGLSGQDFNAFHVLKAVDPTIATADLLRQIEAKQLAYDIVAPLLDSVETALRAVNSNYIER